MSRLTVLGLVFAVSTGACVKKGIYEDALAQLASSAEANAALQAELEQTRGTLEAQLSACRDESAARQALADSTAEELAACRSQLESARSMLDASGEESRRLAARLEELASIEAELRDRDRIFREIVQAFQGLIDNGYVEVAIERGRLVIKMPQDILFESGSADIGEEGRGALEQVATVLAALNGRRFQVEGHTDNVPIHTRTFPSNWELSSARALAVVHLFEETGVPPTNVSAGAFGEWQPRGENETTEGRAANRRIEIVMVPDLEAIFGRITR
ncbi:MAG: OmpA family protein [Myxococcales bacterium]|nr:OmpA family protein [Myxococcales bacterium]MCB9530953.1 OmpA family protein [Myxococcales bacterium]MCB9532873.1 OmpA family protein [Myxococcales bacterium]